MSELSDNKRYVIEYRTNYNEEYWHSESVYAPNEGRAVDKFNRFCRKHEIRLTEIRLTEMRVNQVA